MDDLERTYEATQLAPDELAELREKREAEATAERRRDWARSRRGTIIDRDRAGSMFEPPRALTDLQEAGGRVRGCPPVDEPPAWSVGTIGPHPGSKRNGSGFTGVRWRIKSTRWG